MKIKLLNGNKNCTAYGIKFNGDGIAEAEQKVVQSLLDARLVVEVKAVKKTK